MTLMHGLLKMKIKWLPFKGEASWIVSRYDVVEALLMKEGEICWNIHM